MALSELRETLQKHADAKRADNFRKFFKYCREDVFWGVPAATIRRLAKQFCGLSFEQITILMKSNVHDERSTAHAILRYRFNRGDDKQQEAVFNFYLKHRQYIRDWDGVDDSAPYIVGPFLLHKDKSLLYQMASSKTVWDRRIAIVATWWFIRNNQFNDTLKIVELLLNDKHDLIHKASGWMLREVGKRDLALLKNFLAEHQRNMPRTMLRYAIERFPEDERKHILTSSRTTKC